MTFEGNEHTNETENRFSVKFLGPASFGQLGLNSDFRITFPKSWNGVSNYIPENVKYTPVKYGKTFCGRHTALTLAVVKTNRA